MDKPKFTHDCDRCRFLGSETVGGEDRDYYLCDNGPNTERTFIMRTGNEGPEYASGVLFQCVELTRLDKIALMGGLELTASEESRLLRLLASQYRNGLSLRDYRECNTALQFGSGNVMFPEGY